MHRSLKFASYNIHKGIGLDRRRNPERIIDVLNEIDADIIALQEADRRFGKRDAVLIPTMLARYSDYQAVPLEVQIDSIGWHGNAILVRKSFEILGHDIVHIPYLEPRGAVMARIRCGDVQLCIAGMHLDLSGLWRTKQAAAIGSIAENFRGDDPIVLMGDLNEWSAKGGCLRTFAQHYDFAQCGRSFHVRGPVAALDHIMHSRDLRVIASGVHISPTSRKASDHFPVWAEIALTKTSQ
jgi:endonuclease/exonuclease/phosphatase family metal-dependent hydrolase